MSEIMTTVFTQSTNPAAIFKLIDKDDSKSLDVGEMTTALAEFGLSAEVTEKVMKALDTNGDGVVDEAEFKAGFETFKNTIEAEGGTPTGGGVEAKEIDFADLKTEIDTAFGEGKAVLVCDPSGKSSSFLQYNGTVVDCKGLFVLDKMHKNKTDEEIVEACRTHIVEAMKAGAWVIMELGKAAPQFDQFTSDSFPLAEIMSPNYGKKEDFGAFIPDSEKTGGIFIPKGDWSEKGNGMVISTAFGAEDYAEFLSGSWPDFPFDALVKLHVKQE